MLRARNCACTSIEVQYSRFVDPFVEFSMLMRMFVFAISSNRTKCTRTLTETTNTNITYVVVINKVYNYCVLMDVHIMLYYLIDIFIVKIGGN